VLTAEQVQQILGALELREQVAVRLAIHSGCDQVKSSRYDGSTFTMTT